MTTDLFAADIPASLRDAVEQADASWRPVLIDGLEAMMHATPAYLSELASQPFLPTGGRLFAAFSQPLDAVRYVLVGEGPYPREQSATGVSFMDGAVGSLWSEKGLSKQVNRATSLRNFMKMLLVISGRLDAERTSGDALASIGMEAMTADSPFIDTLADLQRNLTDCGFLLLNASLVFRPDVPPLKEAKAWQPLISRVLQALHDHAAAADRDKPTLVLWGKVAEQLKALPLFDRLPKAVSEHPYNLTFIANPVMQQLFRPMHLLRR